MCSRIDTRGKPPIPFVVDFEGNVLGHHDKALHLTRHPFKIKLAQRCLSISFLLLCHFLDIASAQVMTGTITFQEFAPYQQGRVGVKSCVQDYGGNGNLGDVVQALSCGSPYYDSCVCRPDLAVTGSSFLTKCINSLCASNSVDLSQGLLIWDAYCSLTTFTSINTHTMSFAADAAYQAARPCAKSCIQDYGGNGNLGDIPEFLQCPSPWFDSCLCRKDLLPQGASFLTSCVSRQCQNSVDVSQALAEYLNYCGYTTAAGSDGTGVTASSVAASVSASSTVSGGAAIISLIPVKTTSTDDIITLPSPTATTPVSPSTGTAQSSSPSGGLSLGDRISLGLGLGLGIPTLLVTIAMCWRQYLS